MSYDNPMEFNVGETHKALIPAGTGKPYKIHIVHVINEGFGEHIVYRFFGKHKQWWHYGMESRIMLDLYVEQAKQMDEKNKFKA